MLPPAEPAPEPDAPPVPAAPEPEPPVPPPMPLPGDELVPLVPDVAPPVAPPVVPPEAPPVAPPELGVLLSAPFSSRRQFARSVPVMPRHLLLVVPVAALGGVVLLPLVALGVELVLPAVLGLAALLPVEPELCAIETLASAKSAAAVAALRIFNVMSVLPPTYLVVGDPLLPPEPMPDPLLPAPEPAPPLGCLGALLPDAPLLGVLLGVLLLAPPLVPPAAAPEPDLAKYASHS